MREGQAGTGERPFARKRGPARLDIRRAAVQVTSTSEFSGAKRLSERTTGNIAFTSERRCGNRDALTVCCQVPLAYKVGSTQVDGLGVGVQVARASERNGAERFSDTGPSNDTRTIERGRGDGDRFAICRDGTLAIQYRPAQGGGGRVGREYARAIERRRIQCGSDSRAVKRARASQRGFADKDGD